MNSAGMDNDTRGWVMCIVSGFACIAGTGIVCVDLVVRLIPSLKHFRIQDSNAFLACSLSLSFGVMVFSALNGMLPSSKRYLTMAGIEDQKAGFIMMACFVAGFLGIQAVTRFLHQFMPSHVVDCDHTHDEPVDDHRASSLKHRHTKHSQVRRGINGSVTESTPLLPSEPVQNGHLHPGPPASTGDLPSHAHGPPKARPSIFQLPKRVISFMRDTKPNCDDSGPCFGYSDPCGQECFKHFGPRVASNPRTQSMIRSNTAPPCPCAVAAEDAEQDAPMSPISSTPGVIYPDQEGDHGYASEDESQPSEDLEAQHHHHVPTNAFLSIGLQTVIAIALHKFPEGFITYATNHASPALGFNVFMALFVHNIADGFAMALPLYMALGSRVKAIFWSSLLGGLSQPIGAAIAVLWFKLANRSNIPIDNVAYACMFAVTAGIMTSVALQLFVESLSLNHNRNLNIFFAFLGMTILGLSDALVAD